MRILAIETSCDETAIAILEATEIETGTNFAILANSLISQIELHREYGGVYPTLAKREHAKNLVPLLVDALEKSGLKKEGEPMLQMAEVQHLFEREPELFEVFASEMNILEVPEIDAIAVTSGPGLPPALWLGVNLARALALIWQKPLVGVNHMEGHLLAGLGSIEENIITLPSPSLPLLGLLISGGHTELVAMNPWLSYNLLGHTKDDAVGEAFDKVARMLDLPYPGGPEISRLAEAARSKNIQPSFSFPRPMMNEENGDFSFSGLKTSVMYFIKKQPEMTDALREEVALEFENAATDVLWKKTAWALEKSNAKTLALGGGVSANKHIRDVFRKNMGEKFPQVAFHIPGFTLTTDNALMIAIAGYFRAKRGGTTAPEDLAADSNLSLA